MSQELNPNCNCPKTECPRHGDCMACVEAHKAVEAARSPTVSGSWSRSRASETRRSRALSGTITPLGVIALLLRRRGQSPGDAP